MVVIETMRTIIFDTDWTISQIENVTDVAIDKFNGNEVLIFSSIVHYQT